MSLHALTHAALCGMCGIPCGIPCGVKSLIHKGCAACAASTLTGARAQVRACVHMRMHAHPPAHRTCRTCRTCLTNQQVTSFAIPHNIPHTPHKRGLMMDSIEKRAIRCTQDNAADMRALVRRWPALQSLVTSLQADGVFPGLRGLTITLEGPREWVDQGLAAELPLESKGGAQ